MLLKKGSKGEDVKKLQSILGLTTDGDFGTRTEDAVKSWQQSHGLVADGIVGDKTWNKLLSTTTSDISDIIYDPLKLHITPSKNRRIKYLVIHYTAGCSSKTGAAKSNRNVWNNVSASADYCVDDTTTIQANPDPLQYYCWAVGDGKGKNGIYNKDCISIELCSNLKPGTNKQVPNHAGWYFTEDTLNRAIKLAKMLMKKYNIPLNNVIRHYDVSGKYCPGIIGWNTGILYDEVTGKPNGRRNNDDIWKKFKESLK